jgi:peptidoglycan/xylan/chitin deacetylase (PgdA/CDA1 family)
MNQDVERRRGHWPDGATWAFVMSVDFDAEEVWIGENPENEHRPGVLSQGAYGPKVALPLLLKMFHELSISATFFVPGRDAERHPGRVREILAAGHEVGHHGYTHRSPTDLTESEELEELHAGLDALRLLGANVRGYRSPSWDFSPHTSRLLEKLDFEYSSNLMDDIKPYRHQGVDLVEVPIHWSLDDAPHFWFDATTWTKTIRSAQEVERIWLDEIEGISNLGGVAVLTVHPFVIGRPGRLPALRRTLEYVNQRSDVWIATAAEVAAWARENW